MIPYMIYTGSGEALHDVPARDLAKEEVDAAPGGADALLASGLYELYSKWTNVSPVTGVEDPTPTEDAPQPKRRSNKS